MKPRLTLVTLAVANLEKSVAFYRDGLGLPTEGIVGTEHEHGAVAFFTLESGLKLALWAQEDLMHDTGLPKTPPSASSASLAHNTETKEEVDAVMAQAKKAGAKIVKEAANTFYGGYAGYFLDPDQHLWEVAFNPQMIPGKQP